jgi:hypothetical protein
VSKKLSLIKLVNLCYEQFNQTEDFANGDAFVSYASSCFNNYVNFWITELEVFDRGDHRSCMYSIDCEIDEEARADLSLLGIGLQGSVLEPENDDDSEEDSDDEEDDDDSYEDDDDNDESDNYEDSDEDDDDD